MWLRSHSMCTGDFHGTQGGWRLPRGTQLGVGLSQPGNVSDTLTSCPSLLPLTDALPTLALFPPLSSQGTLEGKSQATLTSWFCALALSIVCIGSLSTLPVGPDQLCLPGVPNSELTDNVYRKDLN